eukprot:7380698-Prymnesium_polylepis.3
MAAEPMAARPAVAAVRERLLRRWSRLLQPSTPGLPLVPPVKGSQGHPALDPPRSSSSASLTRRWPLSADAEGQAVAHRQAAADSHPNRGARCGSPATRQPPPCAQSSSAVPRAPAEGNRPSWARATASHASSISSQRALLAASPLTISETSCWPYCAHRRRRYQSSAESRRIDEQQVRSKVSLYGAVRVGAHPTLVTVRLRCGALSVRALLVAE